MPSIDMNERHEGRSPRGVRLRRARGFACLTAASLAAVLALVPAAEAQVQLQVPQTQPVPAQPAQGQPAPQVPQVPPAPGAAPAVSPAQVFGDWTRRCTTNPPPQASPPKPGQSEVCFLVQQATDKRSQRPILKVTVGYFGPQRQPGAVITLPLGVPLSHGLTVAVDGKELDRVPFQFCTDGCSAFLPMEDKTVAAFKAGNQATASIFNGQETMLNLNISLAGFTAGYDSIK